MGWIDGKSGDISRLRKKPKRAAAPRSTKSMEPTVVSMVEEVLQGWPEDFVTEAELIRVLPPGTKKNAVNAALHHLRKYRAADVVIQAGRGYWFATPQYDQRSRTVDLRTPEIEPRSERHYTPGSRRRRKLSGSENTIKGETKP